MKGVSVIPALHFVRKYYAIYLSPCCLDLELKAPWEYCYLHCLQRSFGLLGGGGFYAQGEGETVGNGDRELCQCCARTGASQVANVTQLSGLCRTWQRLTEP